MRYLFVAIISSVFSSGVMCESLGYVPLPRQGVVSISPEGDYVVGGFKESSYIIYKKNNGSYRRYEILYCDDCVEARFLYGDGVRLAVYSRNAAGLNIRIFSLSLAGMEEVVSKSYQDVIDYKLSKNFDFISSENGLYVIDNTGSEKFCVNNLSSLDYVSIDGSKSYLTYVDSGKLHLIECGGNGVGAVFDVEGDVGLVIGTGDYGSVIAFRSGHVVFYDHKNNQSKNLYVIDTSSTRRYPRDLDWSGLYLNNTLFIYGNRVISSFSFESGAVSFINLVDMLVRAYEEKPDSGSRVDYIETFDGKDYMLIDRGRRVARLNINL